MPILRRRSRVIGAEEHVETLTLMNVLAIEAACPPGTLALVRETQVVAFRRLEDARRTTETFAVVIQEMLEEARWSANEIELVATTHGPGSFTGLRIASTAAKVFAYAVGAKAIGLDTLEVIARQTSINGDIEGILDAQRGELFAKRFSKQNDTVTATAPTRIVSIAQWLDEVSTSTAVTGPALEKVSARLPNTQIIVPETSWHPRADTVGIIAQEKLTSGAESDPWKLAPHYYRRSAAEEKADRRTRPS